MPNEDTMPQGWFNVDINSISETAMTAQQMQSFYASASELLSSPTTKRKRAAVARPSDDSISPMDGMKFGCDPELFVFDKNTGKYVTAEGLIPGTKFEPFKVDCGAVQVDGMAAEFNIDPVTDFKTFDHNITTVMKQLSDMLPKGFELHQKPAVIFDEDIWDDAPMKAKELGCTPDFDAWTGEVNTPPKCDIPRLRTASGHLHIGWTEGADTSDVQHIAACRDLVRQLDYYLGAWSVMHDPDSTRRKLYGKAGAMRYKPYGVEYRVLSNFWLKDTASRKAVWNRMQTAIWRMSSSFLPEIGEGTPMASPFKFNELLIKSINESKLEDVVANKFYNPIYTL